MPCPEAIFFDCRLLPRRIPDDHIEARIVAKENFRKRNREVKRRNRSKNPRAALCRLDPTSAVMSFFQCEASCQMCRRTSVSILAADKISKSACAGFNSSFCFFKRLSRLLYFLQPRRQIGVRGVLEPSVRCQPARQLYIQITEPAISRNQSLASSIVAIPTKELPTTRLWSKKDSGKPGTNV